MSNKTKGTWWAGLLGGALALIGAGCGCNGGNPGTNIAPDALYDAQVDAADTRPDAGDAKVEDDGQAPDGAQYNYCDAAFFQLPPTQDDLVLSPVMGKHMLPI